MFTQDDARIHTYTPGPTLRAMITIMMFGDGSDDVDDDVVCVCVKVFIRRDPAHTAHIH